MCVSYLHHAVSMTKATIAKLTLLIFLAFIVCLPEFFPSEVLQVRFLCAPFDPCGPNSGRDHHDGQVYEMYGNASITRPRCEPQNATNQDEGVKEWFVCETHADLQSLGDNASSSEVDMEVIVTLQITAPPLLQNVTLNGHFNRSGLHIEKQHNITLFSCCIQNVSAQQNKDKTPQSSSSNQNSVSHKPNTSEPGIFSAGSPDVTSSEGKNASSNHTPQSNRSHCLFHAKDIPSMSSKKARWWSVSTVVWLVLVLMVLILVLLGVRDQVVKNRHKKKVIPLLTPANQPKTFSNRRVKSLGDLPDDVSALSIEDKELFLEKMPSDYSRGHLTSHQRKVSSAPTERSLQVFQELYKRGLSPIPELSLTDGSLGENEDEYDEEATSDGEITEEAFLHHRSLPSIESCH
ncbi:hypothetical protein PHYPO_G00167650 [Pangasianodon hypophthalmus]|uniref:Uncharacterized protein n=1 Tax=Pangasianodon hypophthalmus TaxID=310915 RepID=A0A5N5JHA9_PANHP|nr:uncharacterized protein si:dkey-192k22.2 isoform X2 [Pangasianodon hypophthalmus]KAB5518579.1 hypothetical protein PHYPO_G00167650 [Pangasianodon hypophthalmus]